jgi:Cu2+-containing amine oxidase
VRDEFAGDLPNFRVITLQEPPKIEMIQFLEREHQGQSHTSRPARNARVQVIIQTQSGSNEMVELTVNLDQGVVLKKEHLPGKHPYIDSAYMQAVESACRADPRIEVEIQKLKLPEGGTVVIEPWAYATDGMSDMTERTSMVRPRILQKCCIGQLTDVVVLVLYASFRKPRRELLCVSSRFMCRGLGATASHQDLSLAIVGRRSNL